MEKVKKVRVTRQQRQAKFGLKRFLTMLSAYLYKLLLVSNGIHEHLEDLLFIDYILPLPRSGAKIPAALGLHGI